ncbi:MAG: hypothetical protein A2Y33_07605 [Spirochaetes bacterium GWF1_51_8]|nr:MAG: hypothetical protein A2Y33_07605 [Spirochaetes bacterium GWF1_51_8]
MTLKSFRESFAEFVNIDELVFDIALVVLAFFLRGMIIPPGKTILDILDPLSGTILLLAVFFSAAYFIGFLQSQYAESMKEIPEKYEVVKGITMITLFGMIFTLIFVFFTKFPKPEFILILVAIFGGISIAISGLSLSTPIGRKAGCGVSIPIFLISMLIINFLIGFYGIDPELMEENSELAYPALRQGGIGVGVFFVLLILTDFVTSKFLNGKNRTGNAVTFLIFRFIIPVMLALSSGIWQEIAGVGLLQMLSGGDFWSLILPIVLFLSVLGMRVLLALAPPYRIINTGIGIISFTVYLISLVSRLFVLPAD